MFAPGTSLSVDDRGRLLLSPSGAQTWRRCKRRFGWRYLDGHREPEGSGARLGKAYHASLERYLLGSLRGVDDLRRDDFPELTPEQWTTLRRIVRAALASGAYPEPRPGVVVAIERDLSLTCEHASWRGRVDAILAVPPGPLWENDVLEVRDHKTTRSLKDALTEATLPLDPQAVFYSAAVHEGAAAQGMGIALVALNWTYVQTHGVAEVQPVCAALTPEEATERMRALDAEVGAAVHEIAVRRPPVLELAPSWDQCDAFGGCPHRERCGERPILAALSAALDGPTRAPAAPANGEALSQQQQFQSPTFAERYSTQPVYQASVEHQPPAQPAPSPQAVASVAASQAAVQQPQHAPQPVGAPPPALQALFQQPAAQPGSIQSAAVQPQPEQQIQPPVYNAVNRPGGPATAYPDLRAAAGGPVQSAPAPTSAPILAAQPPSPAPAPAPVQAAYSAPQAQQAQAPAPAPVYVGVPNGDPRANPVETHGTPEQVKAAYGSPASMQTSHQPAPGTQTAVGFVLLITCAATGALDTLFRRVIAFEHVVQRAAQILRNRQGIQDFRLVDYGQGPGLLATAIQGALLEVQVGPGDALLVSHLGPEWQAAGTALRAQAAAVIQGTAG